MLASIERWLNDDVVIPLAPRAFIRKDAFFIRWEKWWIQGPSRRKSILLDENGWFGNLQWMRGLLPSCFKQNPVAGMVAGRRLFRVGSGRTGWAFVQWDWRWLFIR